MSPAHEILRGDGDGDYDGSNDDDGDNDLDAVEKSRNWVTDSVRFLLFVTDI